MFWGSPKTSENSMNPGRCATVVRGYGQCHLHRERHGIKYHSTDSQTCCDLSETVFS